MKSEMIYEFSNVMSPDIGKQCEETLIRTTQALIQCKDIKIEKLYYSIEHIIWEVFCNKSVKLCLAHIRTTDEYTFSHCVNTTVYALIIGKSLDYTPKDMKELAIGTLLHDIGKIILDADILYKENKLSKSEIEYVHLHALEGYKLIKNRSIPEASKKVVRNHHERIDGSGYPYGLHGSQIDEFSKIAGIADVFDALTSDRCYRQKCSTREAVNYLIENKGTMFDDKMVNILIEKLAII